VAAGCGAASDLGHLFPRHFARSVMSPSSRHLSQAGIPKAYELTSLSDDRRSFCLSRAPSLSRASLYPARDQSEASSGSNLARCRPERLQPSLRDLPPARTPAARRRSHHHGCGRAIRAAGRVEWPAFNEDSAAFDAPPDRASTPNTEFMSPTGCSAISTAPQIQAKVSSRLTTRPGL
jgi:hypothetical protein